MPERAKVDRRNMRRAIGEAAVTSFERIGTRLDLNEAELGSLNLIVNASSRRIDRVVVDYRDAIAAASTRQIKQHNAFIGMTLWQRLRWLLSGKRG